MKRGILSILFGLVLLSAAVNACTTPTGELHVNSDTTLCPGTYIIDDSDYDGAVIINASNVVLDCGGATLDANGSAGYAIFAQDVTGITVRNCNIQGYTWGGIEFEGVNYSVIDGNNISSCGAYGHGAIFIPYSSYNNITDNRITSNPLNAISIGSWYPTSCQGNRVTGNTITGNTAGGVSIQQPSSSTVLENNYICDNGDSDISSGNESLGTGSGNTCDTASNWNDDGATGCTYACSASTTTTTLPTDATCSSCSDCNTKLNGNYSTVKLTADILDQSEGCLTFVVDNVEFDCQGHTIDGAGFYTGVYMLWRTGITIENCVITGFYEGISLASSPSNTLTNNNLTDNTYGISLWNSSGNTVNSNRVCSNTGSDFYLLTSVGNSGDDNTCDNPGDWNDDGTTGCTYACSGGTTTTTSTTTTTTITGECTLVGDTEPCGTITLAEVIDLISLWAADGAGLSDVIDLINAWAG